MLAAAEDVLQPEVILMIFAGNALGMLVGALPGLTATMGMALFSPLTFFMPPTIAIPFVIGIYKGGTYGGSISAILIGTPGTASNAATVMDGYPMAKKGLGGKALKAAICTSALGDMVGNVALILVAGFLAQVALSFGPPEFFALILFSMTVIASLTSGSLVKGFIVASLGALLALAGSDPVSGALRYTFGSIELQGGISFIPLMIGLFGFSEVLVTLSRPQSERAAIVNFQGDREANRITLAEIFRYPRTVIRSSLLGLGLGALPGIGAESACWVAYGMAKRASREPEKFGTGHLEGLIAPEVANNAVVGAALIPLLTFGVPGDAVTAVMLGTFTAQGLQPGPLLFRDHPEVIYGLYVTMFVAGLVMFVTATLTIRLWVKVLEIPKEYLYPIIGVLCVVGSYAINNSLFDVGLMLVAGLAGFVLRMGGFAIPPMVLAFILAPKLELALQQSLVMSDGGVTIFVSRPISAFFIVLTAISIALFVRRDMRSGGARGGPAS